MVRVNQNMSNKVLPLFSKTPLCFAVFLSLPVSSVFAEIQPSSASLNYAQKALSITGNPAAAALVVERNDPHVMTGGIIDFGAGLEYGDVDDLFQKIDELREEFQSSSSDSDSSGGSAIPSNPDSDINWDDIFNEYPDLEGRLDALKDQVATTAALAALIATQGYAKAELKGGGSFVLNENFYDGTLIFGLSYKANSQVKGLFEEINFDSAQAKAELQKLPNFTATDPIQKLDLSGGIALFYNPANHNSKLTIDNDSLLLVKASKINQFSLSYSRKLQEFEGGDLYWGVKPTLYRVGLTNVSARIGDITDSEALFDDIKNADFVYENGFDIDLGLVWATPNYQLGATLTNVIENSYDFPEIDRRRFSSNTILQQLDRQDEFTMQRQLKLEAGIYTEQRHWSLNVEADANPIEDPMRDEYQWVTVTGGYAADSWWLPSARLGFSRNLAGTELSYINAGITVMKFFNIDAATTTETVSLDGNKLRRGFNVRLGVQFDY